MEKNENGRKYIHFQFYPLMLKILSFIPTTCHDYNKVTASKVAAGNEGTGNGNGIELRYWELE